jgi:hypothetical protein
MATGHPLDKRGNFEEGELRIFISQSTITKEGFDLLVCDNKSGNIRSIEVDLIPLYKDYKEIAISKLTDIENA